MDDAFRTAFETYGFVRLKGGFSAEGAEEMAEAVWAELARRHGIHREDRSTWTITEPRGLGGLRKGGVFGAVATPRSPRRSGRCSAGTTGRSR